MNTEKQSERATTADINGINTEMARMKAELIEIAYMKAELKVKMASMKKELNIVRWMGVIIFAGIIALTIMVVG